MKNKQKEEQFELSVDEEEKETRKKSLKENFIYLPTAKKHGTTIVFATCTP